MAVAGSIVVTVTQFDGGIHSYSIAWLSDAAGNVSDNTFGCRGGELVQVNFTPAGAPDAPTTLYDVTVIDAMALDVLQAAGANLSATLSTFGVSAIGTYHRRVITAGLLTPVVTNAGNAKRGTIELLIR